MMAPLRKLLGQPEPAAKLGSQIGDVSGIAKALKARRPLSFVASSAAGPRAPLDSCEAAGAGRSVLTWDVRRRGLDSVPDFRPDRTAEPAAVARVRRIVRATVALDPAATVAFAVATAPSTGTARGPYAAFAREAARDARAREEATASIERYPTPTTPPVHFHRGLAERPCVM